MSIVINPQDRTMVAREGRGLEVVLPSTATAGTTALVDCCVGAGTAGPPLHTHPASDETFIVSSGRLLVHIDGRLVELAEGGVVHITRGTPHSFATPPDHEARFFTVHTPGGFEQFHVEAAAAEHKHGRPLDVPELIDLAQQFDYQLIGPPLLPNGQLAEPS